MSKIVKTLALSLTLIVVLSSLIIFDWIPLGLAQSGTNVSGIISSDTTWTKANSPHNLVANVLVKEGVTLTVEAGANVNLNSYYILVNGTLQAKGTSSDRIVINGIDGSPPLGPLGSSLAMAYTYGITINGGCTIENAIINQMRLALGSSNKISNSTINGFISIGQSSIFTNNVVTGLVFAGDNSQVLGNIVYGGIETEYGSPTISSNIISGGANGILCYLSENAVITDNTITKCGSGIFAQGSNGLISGNFIANNTNGIAVNYGAKVTIKENTIAENHVGIQLPSSASPVINYNNIQNNSYSVYLGTSVNLDATNNWWGTTDTQAINQTIYDIKNDFNLGSVTFIPFLSSPNTQAPTGPTFTPEPPISSSPSPTVPELSWLAILPLLLAIPLIALILLRKKRELK
jgi:parallel beta-helix repeat protein